MLGGMRSDASARAQYARNIRRYYLYTAAMELALWSPIWVLYLQQQRGL